MSDTAERYRRAKAIFLEVSDIETAQRSTYLDEACKGDTELRREVEALLVDDRTRGVALDRVDEETHLPKLPPGYRVERELGRGGMGVVWLAERDTGDFRQRVALKLLSHDALRDPDRRARFRTERRILASLEHPHIARLLDGGMLADGTPYIAMEYVEGERLDDWVARARPKLRVLLRLFVQICRAVQAAHQRLVVHRDLKPANILVDAYGAPKLLDFGIAKLIDDSAEVEVATGTGMQLLTPRFAAPEQVRGEAITTATDVYALGVVFYELLTGQSPYGRGVAATPDQLRAICDTDPLRPSLVARTRDAGATMGTPSANLRGDLDAILLRCLRKQPAARYRGAAELADDLEAFLDGRPVAARAGSRRYALTKFVSRHRYLVASTLFVLFVLAAASVLLLSQLEATRLQRDLAAGERDRAEAVTAFLTEVFREADPYRNDGREPSIKEVLARGVERIKERDDMAAGIRGSIETTLATVTHNIGDLDAALVVAERSVATLRPAAAAEPTRLALALKERGSLHVEKGRHAVAERDYREALALVRASDGLTAAFVLNSLGSMERSRDRTEAAVDYYRQSLQALLRHVGQPSMKAAAATLPPGNAADLLSMLLHNECACLERLGKLEHGLRVCADSIALKQRLYPGQRARLQSTFDAIGNIHSQRGDFAVSADYHAKALAIAEDSFGPRHSKVGVAALNLGAAVKQTGDFGAALALYRRAADIFAEVHGAEHRYSLIARNNIANIHIARKNFDEALRLHREVLAARRRTLGADATEIGQSLMNISLCEQGLGQHEAAIHTAREAVAHAERVSGKDHHETHLNRVQLANTLLLAGQANEAASIARDALPHFSGEGQADNELLRALLWFIVAHELIKHPETRGQALHDARAALAVAEKQPNNEFLVPAEVREWLRTQGAK